MVINLENIIIDLEKKGLVIKDKEEFDYYVKNFNVNTFLTGYSTFFSDENGNFNNANASDIIKLYNFDRNLGNHILRNILIIEKILNTRVAIETINHYNIEDKCLLKLDINTLKNSVLRNISEVTPYIEFQTMLYRMVKYLDTNKYTKKMVDYDVNDDIFKWRDVPLDLLCLSWSFSTTFSFFIASDRVLRENILSTFGIDKSLYDGFVDFIKNVINLRNNITHNGVVYDSPVKYITDELINLYLFLFKENVSKEDFRLIHLIRMISIISNDMYLYNKTVQFGTNLSIGEPYKGKIAKLFIV